MKFLYNIGIGLLALVMRVGALFTVKLSKGVVGRKRIWSDVQAFKQREKRPTIWFHCASYGEFEQGRPVLEAIRKEFPQHAVFLTFFSPSGYDAFAHKEVADGVSYMPLDNVAHAQRWFDELQPVMWVLVKYDLWANHLLQAHQRQIPVILFASNLRSDQAYFGWMRRLWEKALSPVFAWHVQTERSRALLQEWLGDRVQISGDTRADRVLQIAETPLEWEMPRSMQTSCVVVAGSTWRQDELHWREWMNQDATGVQLFIVPHEVSAARIAEVRQLFPEAVCWSACGPEKCSEVRVVIVDQMGLLSKLYRFADVAYIGGGFGSGIHNTLEPAAYGVPILFGPRYEKFEEAKGLIEVGAACGGNAAELQTQWRIWLRNPEARHTAGGKAKNYVRQMRGATERVMRSIRQTLEKP